MEKKVCSMCGKEIKDDEGSIYVAKSVESVTSCHSKCKLNEAAKKYFK